MALQAINQEAVTPTAQALLAFLDREDIQVPGNMLESIVSGKSLLRALVNGQLVLAQDTEAMQAPQQAPQAEEPEQEEAA